MISKILITISAMLIFAGLFGIRSKTLGGKMFFLCISSIGMTVLSFVELNAYGLLGGIFQMLFRLISLLFLVLLFQNICKKNGIVYAEEICGIGRNMPYVFLVAAVYSMIVIGMPATGTFTGILYSEIGLLAGSFGVFTYVGMIGNIAGIAVSAALLFPMLKKAYFPDKDKETRESVIMPGKGMMTMHFLTAFLLALLSIYQKPVMTAAGTLMDKIFG